MELVIGHGDNGKDEVNKVERAQEDVEDEEENMHGARGHQSDLEETMLEEKLKIVVFSQVSLLQGIH